jgi:hypothetical protein
VRVPVVIRSVADIRILSASPKAAKRLPPEGIVVAIPGLDDASREAFRLQTRRYARACGCAAGGAIFLLASIAVTAYAASLALDHAWASLARALVAGVILVPTLTVAGKFFGLWIARLRFRRTCARLILSLSGELDCSLGEEKTP